MSRIKRILPKEIHAPFTLLYILTVTTTFIATLGYFFVPQEVPLFYSLAQPHQQLAPKIFLFTVPVLSLFLSLINGTILLKLHKYDLLLLQLLSWVTVTFEALLLFALVRIIFIVL